MNKIYTLDLPKERKNYIKLCRNVNEKEKRKMILKAENKTNDKSAYVYYSDWKQHINEEISTLRYDQLIEIKMYLRLNDRREHALSDYDKSFLYAALVSIVTNMIIYYVAWIINKSCNPALTTGMKIIPFILLVITILILYIRKRNYIDRFFYGDLLEIVEDSIKNISEKNTV